MPDAVCIKAGGIDDKDARDFKKTSVEFYCKDRMAYSKPVEGAEQKPVSTYSGFWGMRGSFGAGTRLTVLRCSGREGDGERDAGNPLTWKAGGSPNVGREMWRDGSVVLMPLRKYELTNRDVFGFDFSSFCPPPPVCVFWV